ncbi:MAG: glucoamylase family protein [bacterium]
MNDRPMYSAILSVLRSIPAPGAFVLLAAVSLGLCGCGPERRDSEAAFSGPADETAFIDDLQERTFHYFWELCNPQTGLAPDRAPSQSFASVSATGFALTSYVIGAERGWVTRESAARRVLRTLRFFREAPQDSTPRATGYHGFYYHFLDPDTGERFGNVELSTVDTALLLAGALFCQSYFDGSDAVEDSIRTVAEELYLAADWTWASVRPPLIGHGWTPENGHLPYDWGGYNEAALVYIMALGSPTHPVSPDAWTAWTAGYRWGGPAGNEHVGFAPLFGHQYTHVWIDLRGIRDGFMQDHDLDYFENSRRALLFQHEYAMANPEGWTGYGPRLWGLTACDGPVSGTFTVDGRERTFQTYWARGASFTTVHDDGTVCPSALGGSVPFAPDLVIPALMAMAEDHGDLIYGRYGFLDALNPSFTLDVPVQHGRVVPGVGWYDTDYLGIDQGPIVAMIENHRSELVWRVMRGNPHIVRGLRVAGFTGGWLDTAAAER